MKILVYFLFILSTTVTFGQERIVSSKTNDLILMKKFIYDLSIQDKSVDIILSQYIVVNEPSDELYDYLEVSLEEIRINLMTKNLDEIEYIAFMNMPRKEVKDVDTEDIDPQSIYFLNYKGRQLTALYLEDGKIRSFTLVAKGGNKAHFVCY